jgi:anti-sigma B factor antagonist
MTDMLEMTHELRNGALILRPTKRIDSSTAKSFEEQTNALIAGGAKKVVMDFSDVDYISSAGLRVVLTTAKRAKAEGGGLTLCGEQSNVKDVLEVSGFASIFGVHANVDEALKALGG